MVYVKIFKEPLSVIVLFLIKDPFVQVCPKRKLNSGMKYVSFKDQGPIRLYVTDTWLTDSKNTLIIEPSYLDNTSFDLF